jgi:hypothetical protein
MDATWAYNSQNTAIFNAIALGRMQIFFLKQFAKPVENTYNVYMNRCIDQPGFLLFVRERRMLMM